MQRDKYNMIRVDSLCPCSTACYPRQGEYKSMFLRSNCYYNQMQYRQIYFNYQKQKSEDCHNVFLFHVSLTVNKIELLDSSTSRSKSLCQQ